MSSIEGMQNWDEMQALFHSVMTAPVEDTESLLQSVPDVAMRETVRAMCEAARAEPIGHEQAAARSEDPQRFRGYKVVRLLGSGGSASVYLVERQAGTQRQLAALKVFPRAITSDVMARSFAREEFVLASLAHPAIPLLLDAGLSDAGEPFLVMEYAQGERIDAFCDARRLSIDERLRLMLLVCDALAYSHRSLVLHLDLKPANILASAEEPPIKLLDFGTARLLEADRTMTVAHMATPSYASPEQLRGEPLTTSTDVYSLGAVMYELLSGNRPNAERSATGIAERSLRDAYAERLESNLTGKAAAARGLTVAQLGRSLEGELTTIVTKCMAPAPGQRYASVDAVAEDLRRYLEGRPILARPPSRRYRLRKFVWRNRGAVLAATAALLLIATSVGYALWRQHQALAAAHRAVEMQRFMTRLFRLAHSGATGKPAATVGDLLQVGEETLPSFISDPADLRAAKLSIAESMYDDEDTQRALPLLRQLSDDAHSAGDVAIEAKADILESDLLFIAGNHQAQAQALAERALQLAPDKRVSPELRTEIVALYVQNKDGAGDRSTASMDQLRAAIAESEQAHADENATASAMNILGLGLNARGQHAEALGYFERALAIYKRTPYAACDTAETIKYMGNVEDHLGDDTAALDDYNRSYELQRKCAGDDDLGTLSAHAYMAIGLTRAGRPLEAIAAVEPDLPRWRKAVGKDSLHMNTPLKALVPAYLALGRFTDAEAASREQIRVLHGGTQQKSVNMAQPEGTLAEALAGQHRYAEALPWAKAAVDDYPQPPTSAGEGVKRGYLHERDILAAVNAHLESDSGTPAR